MTVVADISIIPIGEDVSVSKYVKVAINELRKTGLKVEIGAMSATLEAENITDIFKAVERAREEVFSMGVKRLYIILRVDERRDKPISIESKKKAIES